METERAEAVLRKLSAPLLITAALLVLDRWDEDSLLDTLKGGCIAYSPLAQGLLTGR